MRVQIYFDGACNNRGNRIMGIGVAVFIDGEFMPQWSYAAKLDKGTSNIAEWAACVKAMTILHAMKTFGRSFKRAHFTVYSDSQIITNQFNQTCKIHEEAFIPYFNNAKDLAAKSDFTFPIHWIHREKNTKADTLSKLHLK